MTNRLREILERKNMENETYKELINRSYNPEIHNREMSKDILNKKEFGNISIEKRRYYRGRL